MKKNINFLQKIKKPFFVLAPMADVTDYAFRTIISKYGKPDIFWTEFVSADGLTHPLAKRKLLVNLKYNKREHPIIAQIFGANPLNIKKASELCRKLGFDGIDINMGCPDRAIEKQGAGASLIKNKELAKEIIKSAKEGAGDLPILIKTRIGYNKYDKEWLRFLLNQGIDVLTVHLRTRKEMSLVPARWELMKDIVSLRDEINKDILIIGNGDVESIEDGKKKVDWFGCDGVMLGRAIFGNPWLFSKKKPKSIKEKLNVMVEHTRFFEREFKGKKNFAVMKKHFKAYVNGFLGAKELRIKLMEASTAKEVASIVKDFTFK
ncbi:MAG: tRNA-dihydrouridine synthase [Candidatus Paceibacterota bacterium]